MSTGQPTSPDPVSAPPGAPLASVQADAATRPMVLVGDGPLAGALFEQAGAAQRVVRVRMPAGDACSAEAERITMPLDGFLQEVGALAPATIVVDCAEDAHTLACLRVLLGAEAVAGAQVLGSVGDRRLRRAVQSRIEQDRYVPRPVLVDPATLAAERFVAGERLFEIAYWRNQARVHVLLLGFGHLGQALLDEIVTSGIAGRLDQPRLTILADDPDEARRFLAREMPELGASAEISVARLERELLADPGASPIVAAEAAAPLTAILVACETAAATFATALAVADLQDRHGHGLAALYIGGPGRQETLALATPRRSAGDLGRRIAEIADIDAITDLRDYILVRRNALGERLHNAYRELFGGQTGAGVDWNVLPETYRRASRKAGNHLVEKLWTLGLSAPVRLSEAGAIEPTTFAEAIIPIAEATVEDATIRRLARLEHDRWNADRRLDGWQFGEARDDTRRRHPSLVPFDDPRLTASEIAKDVAQIRFVLKSVLYAAPHGAAAQLRIGVLDHMGRAQNGIALAVAQERLAGEPHRFPVLISPLLTASEADAVRALAADLDRLGRKFQLVVPEWYPENRTLRNSALSAQPEFREILARRETNLAPIGPPGLFGHDVWEDPTESQSAQDALDRYVVERADIIVAAAAVPA